MNLLLKYHEKECFLNVGLRNNKNIDLLMSIIDGVPINVEKATSKSNEDQ